MGKRKRSRARKKAALRMVHVILQKGEEVPTILLFHSEKSALDTLNKAGKHKEVMIRDDFGDEKLVDTTSKIRIGTIGG